MVKKRPNFARLLRALGGPKAVAESLLVDGKRPTPAAVSMWITRDHIPYRWRPAIEAMVSARQSLGS